MDYIRGGSKVGCFEVLDSTHFKPVWKPILTSDNIGGKISNGNLVNSSWNVVSQSTVLNLLPNTYYSISFDAWVDSGVPDYFAVDLFPDNLPETTFTLTTTRTRYRWEGITSSSGDMNACSLRLFGLWTASQNVHVANMMIDQQITSNTYFENSWVNYGNGYNPAGYWKDPLNIVHLRGLVCNGSATPTTIFTLPVNYRPMRMLILPVASNNAYGLVVIRPTGYVQCDTGSTIIFCLDGISFECDPAYLY